MEPHTCPTCTRRRTADVTGLAGSSHHDPDGTVTWSCPACTRAQLWEIETQLPEFRTSAPHPEPVHRAA